MMALGQGSQRIEDSLKKYFPNERILRIDSDSTRQKSSLNEALEKAKTGKAKILVGTQMLSKGHHFSLLSLVVVVNADQGLFSNDFRGSERLAQNIIQVAGRAGREKKKGKVEIKNDKLGNVHLSIGKVSFDEAKLAENLDEVIAVLTKAKPSSSKGEFIKTVHMSSTMGPSISVDINV